MSEDSKTTKDIAKLRHDVDILKMRIKSQRAEKRIYQNDFSGHIAYLDKQIKKRDSQTKIKAVNTFAVGHKVKLSGSAISLHAIAPGTIKFIACKLATPSAAKITNKTGEAVRACDRNNCVHPAKDYIWVQWSNGKLYSYHFSQLQLISADDLKPKIGKELSGRIGEWTYDADKKLWKRDGSDKEYTNDEFEDVVYWETHPYDKEDGNDFIKAIMAGTKVEEVEPSK